MYSPFKKSGTFSRNGDSILNYFSIAEIQTKKLHIGAFCQFPFQWIYYWHSSKSTIEETGKTHLCVVAKHWIFLKIQVSTKPSKKVVNTFLLYVFFCSKLWPEKNWPVIVQLWLPMWYQNWRVPKSGIDKVPLRLWPPLSINLDLTLFLILSSLLCQYLEECQTRTQGSMITVVKFNTKQVIGSRFTLTDKL